MKRPLAAIQRQGFTTKNKKDEKESWEGIQKKN
jgi:hypothetical protein